LHTICIQILRSDRNLGITKFTQKYL